MNITEEHLSNMKKLRDYMASLPKDYENFDMEVYAENGGYSKIYPKDAKPECGTVCCLAGHGPAAGILPKTPHAKVSWASYTLEAFGCNIDDVEGDYLFGYHWPNDIGFAIRRMDAFIEHKGEVPEEIIDMHMDESAKAHEDSLKRHQQ